MTLLFTMPGYEAMGTQLRAQCPELEEGCYSAARYANGELHLALQTAVVRRACIILGTIAPPDGHLMAALLLCHTLKKEGAGAVTGLFPYLAYTRQDKEKTGESLGTAWAGRLVRASGFDRLVTIDIHSLAATPMFGLPLTSLSPALLFAEALQAGDLADATLVAPDNGAIPRCEAVSVALGLPAVEVPSFNKRRTAGSIEHSGLIGTVGRRAVLIDDILDTGATLVSASEKLQRAGVGELYVMVTHGLFSGHHWENLWAAGVRRIYCTDTVPPPLGSDHGEIVRLPVLPLLQKAVAHLTV